MKILITGGAGFVGAFLARAFSEHFPTAKIVALDNLRRRGSELNLADFKQRGIAFVHGDIRNPADLAGSGSGFDLVIDASAEPSVLAGLDGSPDYLLQTNLVGTLHTLEYARQHAGRLLFLSTSRVYSLQPLRSIALDEGATRFEIAGEQSLPGISRRGVAEEFPTHLSRSLYGATKLASELILQEYAASYRLPVLVNRCGVIAGPGQFGKADQGVFTHWVMHHQFDKPLVYTGFGGTGKQVRDLLHPADLFTLILKQLEQEAAWNGASYNVGGGVERSVSLCELTAVCREVTGREVAVIANPATTPVDIPLFIADAARVSAAFGWQPTRSVPAIIADINDWIVTHRETLALLLA